MSDIKTKAQELSNVFTQAEHISCHLANMERGMRPPTDYYQANISTAFVLWLAACDKGCLDIPKLSDFLNDKLGNEPQLRSFIIDKIGGKRWDVYRRLIRSYSAEALAYFITTMTPSTKGYAEWMTPASISKLALELEKTKAEGDVADICCGSGAFLCTVASICNAKSLSGADRSISAVCIAKMKASVSQKANFKIEQGDAMLSKILDKSSFDMVFIDPPYGASIEHQYVQLSNGEVRLDFVPAAFPPIGKRSTSEWLWLLKGLDMLKPDGKAIIVMPQGRLFSRSQEVQNRRYLVDAGLVETVITLPLALHEGTGIPLALLVLNKGGRVGNNIRLIDASKVFTKMPRCNILSDEQIREIAAAEPKEGFCAVVSAEEVAKHDYSLYPPEYLSKPVDIPHPVRLSEILLSVGRGIFINREELHELTKSSSERTGEAECRLVSFSNIRDGEIDDNLTVIGSDVRRFSRYVVNDGDVVIGQFASPFKAAVAHPSENTILVASTNIYVLKVDQSKCDPIYLQAYLCSAMGQTQIAGATAGVAIQRITTEGLASLRVPLLPLAQQREFAQRYQDMLECAKIARLQAEKAIQKSQNAFDDFIKEVPSCH